MPCFPNNYDSPGALLHCKLEDRIYKMTFCDDRSANSLSLNLLEELTKALTAAPSLGARAVVLSSKGKTFCSGHNLKELEGISRPKAEELFSASARLTMTIRRLSLPVVAQVQGPAIGAGCQLALSCDFVVASNVAYFQTPGGSLGWFCFTPMASLINTIAPKRALEMLFSGRKVSAELAESWGMINLVASPDQLESSTESFANQVSSGSAEMLALGKSAFYESLSATQPEAFRKAADLMAQTVILPDAQNRIRAGKKH